MHTGLKLLAFLPFLASTIAAPMSPAHLVRRQGSGSVTSAEGLSFYNPNLSAGTAGKSNPSSYTCYSGPAGNFPGPGHWMNFDDMFNLNKVDSMQKVGDSGPEIGAIRNGIVQISKAAKVDARVILAVIIQESTGNVRVPCTNNGVENCGLMQSYNSPGDTYNPNKMQASITKMIQDGTQGTASGPGLVQYFNDGPGVGTRTGGNLWESLRGYNSGSVNNANLSDGRGATPSYVSDVANRLLGWNGYGSGGSVCGF